MKTLVIINEPLAEMALGRNTTLAYILAAFELGHEVYIFNLPKGGEVFPSQLKESIPVFHLTRDKKLFQTLVENYQKLNQEIVASVAENNLEKLQNLRVIKMAEFLPQKITPESLKLAKIEFIIQRIEPMKSPFPPVGNKNVDQFLINLKKLFPHLIFNCPIGLGDKELPQIINQISGQDLATPTAEFLLEDDAAFMRCLNLMSVEYQKLYNAKNVKLVFKPKNSAQSLGVFAIELTRSGDDLATIKNKKISELRATQTYKIKADLEPKELKKISEILCYIQVAKSYEDLNQLTQSQIINAAKNLYNDQILVQPFLQGIKSGDIRVNLLKNSEGNFYVAGQTFRKSLRVEEKKFTTGYSSGGATSQPIEILKKLEIKNLTTKTELILKTLNQNLREKYKNVIELGADFILVGDDKNIFLGEINHHCQALIPVSEAMNKAVNKNTNYQGGFGLAKRALQDWSIS
jgi:hypothetical protein